MGKKKESKIYKSKKIHAQQRAQNPFIHKKMHYVSFDKVR